MLVQDLAGELPGGGVEAIPRYLVRELDQQLPVRVAQRDLLPAHPSPGRPPVDRSRSTSP
jgi:hypothetical protein